MKDDKPDENTNLSNWDDILKSYSEKQKRIEQIKQQKAAGNETGQSASVRHQYPKFKPTAKKLPQNPVSENVKAENPPENSYKGDNDDDSQEWHAPPPPEPPPSSALTEDGENRKYFGVSKEEFLRLIEFRKDMEARNRTRVFMLGVLFMPITLAGALIGYVRAYVRFFKDKNTPSLKFYPTFYPLYPITKVAMAIGIVVTWLIVGGLFLLSFSNGMLGRNEGAILLYLATNFVFSLAVMAVFKKWQGGINRFLFEQDKFGSARWANKDELIPYRIKKGFYLGQNVFFNDKGHILTVAGTRGGKGTNIIIPNLLGAGDIETSWVVIDPKGENCAITARYQRESGKEVVILNPWGLLQEYTGEAQNYNPLDIVSNIFDPNLADDVQMIAEMIVPYSSNDKNSFFTNGARMVIAGLLLHLVTSCEEDERTLTTLWKWSRYTNEDWLNLLADMSISDIPVNGVVIRNAAQEIMKLTESGAETFGSIMSNVLQATDFLKSPPLQESLERGFDPKTLVKGKTIVYVIIPADKLTSHGRWLRLVVTSMMRAVIRKPNKRVTFLLDEFAALGYLPEIETALSTYAGYNVTVWPILQSLIQLESLYNKNWQTFIANCTIRQYFTINDSFSADYVSSAIGQTSNVQTSKRWFVIENAQGNQRLLITPDELRRESGKRIFMFINDLPPAYIDKLPYYKNSALQNRADENPYI